MLLYLEQKDLCSWSYGVVARWEDGLCAWLILHHETASRLRCQTRKVQHLQDVLLEGSYVRRDREEGGRGLLSTITIAGGEILGSRSSDW